MHENASSGAFKLLMKHTKLPLIAKFDAWLEVLPVMLLPQQTRLGHH
jgi:hypothetical protein